MRIYMHGAHTQSWPNMPYNNKNTLYMYMSNQNKKVLLRGHMAHNVPSSCDPKT